MILCFILTFVHCSWTDFFPYHSLNKLYSLQSYTQKKELLYSNTNHYFYRCTFDNIYSSENGGACSISVSSSNLVLIECCNFYNCKSQLNWGAIFFAFSGGFRQNKNIGYNGSSLVSSSYSYSEVSHKCYDVIYSSSICKCKGEISTLRLRDGEASIKYSNITNNYNNFSSGALLESYSESWIYYSLFDNNIAESDYITLFW